MLTCALCNKQFSKEAKYDLHMDSHKRELELLKIDNERYRENKQEIKREFNNLKSRYNKDLYNLQLINQQLVENDITDDRFAEIEEELEEKFRRKVLRINEKHNQSVEEFNDELEHKNNHIDRLTDEIKTQMKHNHAHIENVELCKNEEISMLKQNIEDHTKSMTEQLSAEKQIVQINYENQLEIHEKRRVEMQDQLAQKLEQVKKMEANLTHEKKNNAELLSQVTKKNKDKLESIRTTNSEEETKLKLKIHELESKLTNIIMQYKKQFQANQDRFLEEINTQQRNLQGKIDEQTKLYKENIIKQKQFIDEDFKLRKNELNTTISELQQTNSKLTQDIDLINKTNNENVVLIKAQLTDKFKNIIIEKDLTHKNDIEQIQTEMRTVTKTKVDLEITIKNLSTRVKNIPHSNKLVRDIELLSSDLEFERTEKDKWLKEYATKTDAYNAVKYNYEEILIKYDDKISNTSELKLELAALNERFKILGKSYNDIEFENKQLQILNTSNTSELKQMLREREDIYNEKLNEETTKLNNIIGSLEIDLTRKEAEVHNGNERLAELLNNQRRELLEGHHHDMEQINEQTRIMVKNYEDRIKQFEEDTEMLTEQNNVGNKNILIMKNKMIASDKERLNQIDLLKQQHAHEKELYQESLETIKTLSNPDAEELRKFRENEPKIQHAMDQQCVFSQEQQLKIADTIKENQTYLIQIQSLSKDNEDKDKEIKSMQCSSVDVKGINERLKYKCNDLSGKLNDKNVEISKVTLNLQNSQKDLETHKKQSQLSQEKLILLEEKYSKIKQKNINNDVIIDELSSTNNKLKTISTEKLDLELKTLRNMFVEKIKNQNDVIKNLQEQLLAN